MRKIFLSFLHCYLVATLLNIASEASAQTPVTLPETFDAADIFLSGWTLKTSGNNNTWEVVLNDYYPSHSYSNPKASGKKHIKIDASASREEVLTSPIINCSAFTNGELRFGAWRAKDYVRTLVITIEINDNGTTTSAEYYLNISKIPYEVWQLVNIPLGTVIDHRSSVRVSFKHIGALTQGPLRIDDIALYGSTSTLPTDHFRSRISGDWNNTSVWESSRDGVYWMLASLTPTSQASTITISNSHTVTNTSPLSVDQLTINNGGTLLLAHDVDLNDGAGEDLTIEEGGLLDFSSFQITKAGTMQLNGHLKTANLYGLVGATSTSIASGVSLKEPGPNSLIEYNAAGSQSVSLLPYANLAISGSGEKKLTGNCIVSNSVQLNGGYLVLDEHSLTVSNTLSGSSSSYVKVTGTGQLTIHNIGTDSKTFPIGNSTYNPVTITNGGGLSWTVGVTDNWAIEDPGLDYFRDKAVHRIWSITPSTNLPSTAADITLEYDDSDPLQVGSSFDRSATVWAWYQANEDWLPAEARPLGPTAYGTQKAGVSVNIRSSLLTISNADTPLPIRFRDVRVQQKQGSAFIYFTNETEEGVGAYTLERSGDGPHYKALRVIKPQKNDGSSASYEVEDPKPLEGQNLYRVKGKERTGKIIYSPVVRFNSKEHTPRLTIAPNPASKGTVLLQFSNLPQDNFLLKIYNSQGQQVLQRDLYHAGGSFSYPVFIGSLQPGTYIIELKGKEKLLQRLVIL